MINTERKLIERDDGGLEVWDLINGRWRCCIVLKQEMEQDFAGVEREDLGHPGFTWEGTWARSRTSWTNTMATPTTTLRSCRTRAMASSTAFAERLPPREEGKD